MISTLIDAAIAAAALTATLAGGYALLAAVADRLGDVGAPRSGLAAARRAARQRPADRAKSLIRADRATDPRARAAVAYRVARARAAAARRTG